MERAELKILGADNSKIQNLKFEICGFSYSNFTIQIAYIVLQRIPCIYMRWKLGGGARKFLMPIGMPSMVPRPYSDAGAWASIKLSEPIRMR